MITSPITFAASGNCARYLGAEVRFADIRPDTYTMDPTRLARPSRRAPEPSSPSTTRASPPTWTRSSPSPSPTASPSSRDAAHALGAAYRGRAVGTLAPMTMFSFHPAKHVATGEGGMVVTDDDDLAARMRLFRTHGITGDGAAVTLADFAADGDRADTAAQAGGRRGPWYYEMQVSASTTGSATSSAPWG